VGKEKRLYKDNGYVSMTGAIGILEKPALLHWFKNNTAKFCDKESRRGKEIGTILHEAFQSHIELQEVKIETIYPNEVTNALKGFMLFKKEHPEIKLEKAEIQMVSDTYKVNGTLDVLGKVGDELVLVDWKNSKKGTKDAPAIYPEYLWQLAGYSMMYEDIFKVKINSAYSVVFAKDAVSYSIQKIEREEIIEHFENIVLPCIKIWYHKKKEK
jgi:ATP-dependent exoDNAse (exonuclease V) beta subunit